MVFDKAVLVLALAAVTAFAGNDVAAAKLKETLSVITKGAITSLLRSWFSWPNYRTIPSQITERYRAKLPKH